MLIDDIDFSQYPEETLCRWVHELNTWRWPDDFPYNAPSDFDELPPRVSFSKSPEDKTYFVSEAMDSIYKALDRYVALQWYHLNILNMPKEQSDEFIKGEREGWGDGGHDEYYRKWYGNR